MKAVHKIAAPFLALAIMASLAIWCFAAETGAAYKAVPSADKTTLNGSPVTMQAYKINDSNYVKLRDFAQMVNGTPLNFEVTWDGNLNAINMYTKKAYTSVGGEGAVIGTEEKEAKDTTSAIYVNGQAVSLKGYNIGGNNYFKLRDLGSALGISIDWDSTTKTVVVNSVGETEEPADRYGEEAGRNVVTLLVFGGWNDETDTKNEDDKYILEDEQAKTIASLFYNHEIQINDSPIFSVATLAFQIGEDLLTTSMSGLGTLSGRINGELVTIELSEQEYESVYQIVSQYVQDIP